MIFTLGTLKEMNEQQLTYMTWKRSPMSVSAMFRRMLNWAKQVVVNVYSCFLLQKKTKEKKNSALIISVKCFLTIIAVAICLIRF